MAKSIQMHEIEEPNQGAENRATGSFWEHWFQSQSPSSSPWNVDEHSVWQKAIHLGILAAEKAKF